MILMSYGLVQVPRSLWVDNVLNLDRYLSKVELVASSDYKKISSKYYWRVYHL
jgi:hypothetical protein